MSAARLLLPVVLCVLGLAFAACASTSVGGRSADAASRDEASVVVHLSIGGVT